MKKFRPLALAAATVLSLTLALAAVAQAQGQVPGQVPTRPATGVPAAGPRLALLDVGRVFKSHARFKQSMEAMKRDVTAAEEQMKRQRDEITKLEEDLQTQYRKGTVDYRNMEEDLTRRKTDLTVKVQLQKGKFVQQEAEIYNATYQEILQATDYFYRAHAIDMVLRFNGEPVNVDEPNSVLGFINRPVVWYAPDLDITGYILQDLNRTPQNTATQNNAMPAPRGLK